MFFKHQSAMFDNDAIIFRAIKMNFESYESNVRGQKVSYHFSNDYNNVFCSDNYGNERIIIIIIGTSNILQVAPWAPIKFLILSFLLKNTLKLPSKQSLASLFLNVKWSATFLKDALQLLKVSENDQRNFIKLVKVSHG